MFLNNIKSFLLKKTLKRQLSNVKDESLNSAIVKVGLIVDETHFFKIKDLREEIVLNGIVDKNIKIIVYHDKSKSKEIDLQPKFSLKDVNLKCEFKELIINEFISEEFDLLINYYNENNSFLLLLTHNCKAKFKVGFSTVDKRLNHLLINIDLENYKGFIQELFRYLKILNKI